VKKIKNRAYVTFFLVAVTVICLIYFIILLVINGGDWASARFNPAVYKRGVLVSGTLLDRDDVMLTTGEAVDMALNDIDGASALLFYSCVSRSMILGSEQFKEMELIDQKFGGKLPFMMASSGGEICPVRISEIKAVNRFQNNAFIACLI